MSAMTSDRARMNAGAPSDELDGAAAAFGMAAAVAIVFNTLLAWVKDAYDPLNELMKAMMGHHWRTHGVADLVVFVVVGFVLMSRGFRMSGIALATTVAGACVLAGLGLAGWFLFV